MNRKKNIKKSRVCFGLLGPVLDRGWAEARWEKWRPTVSLFQQEDLLIDRFEMLYQTKYRKLAQQVVEDIAAVSPHTEVNLVPMDFEDPWDLGEVYGKLLDFAVDYAFDRDKEDYLVHITTGTHVAQISLFLLAEARYLPGSLVQTSPGPRRSSRWALGKVQYIDLDLSRYDSLARRFQREISEDLNYLKAGIATRNERFNRMIEQIERVAIRSREPFLLMGPTGAGKSSLARRIFELKKKKNQVKGAFLEVNCATLRGDQAMSTLFGHEKGAFTGAQHGREGLLRAANQGMLFLDEIGELGLDEQAMLLRALEEKRFLPLGADQETESSFQLIAGTNRDLSAAVKARAFREDLLARINLWTYHLPGLVERPEDIEPNLDYELDQFSRSHNQQLSMNAEARKQFLKFATSPQAIWQGNFRDLNAAVTRMGTLADRGRITRADVELETQRLRKAWDGGGSLPGLDSLYRVLGADAEELDRFDQVQLNDVLEVCASSASMAEAGRVLFARSRLRKSTSNDSDRVRKILVRFGLEWEQVRERLSSP